MLCGCPVSPTFETPLTPTGSTDYFSTQGDLITTIDASGNREDRLYSGEYLDQIYHADGSITTITFGDAWDFNITSTTGETSNVAKSPSTGQIADNRTPSGSAHLTWAPDWDALGQYQKITAENVTTELIWDTEQPNTISQIIRNGEQVYPVTSYTPRRFHSR
jgi:hypothetical protein